MDDVREIWSNIAYPVLLVRGTESWAPDPDWVHPDQLAVFLAGARAFLGVR